MHGGLLYSSFVREAEWLQLMRWSRAADTCLNQPWFEPIDELADACPSSVAEDEEHLRCVYVCVGGGFKLTII
jgi:hypothetical protein